MKNIRIGNIEYRETAYFAGSKQGETYEEIICWYPNPYFGKEEKMKAEGWEFDEDGDAHKECCHVSAGCFQSPQSCYSIAMIEWNRAHDEFDVRSVGTRPWRLGPEDEKDFRKVLRLIEESTSEDDPVDFSLPEDTTSAGDNQNQTKEEVMKTTTTKKPAAKKVAKCAKKTTKKAAPKAARKTVRKAK